MTEYRHGTIVGLALLDTELGRAWVLTDLLSPGAKKERTQFKELSVEDLWESSDEAADEIQATSVEGTRDFLVQESSDLSEVKKLTRPTAIQNAEEKLAEQRRNSK
jgi:hypothetical protein